MVVIFNKYKYKCFAAFAVQPTLCVHHNAAGTVQVCSDPPVRLTCAVLWLTEGEDVTEGVTVTAATPPATQLAADTERPPRPELTPPLPPQTTGNSPCWAGPHVAVHAERSSVSAN